MKLSGLLSESETLPQKSSSESKLPLSKISEPPAKLIVIPKKKIRRIKKKKNIESNTYSFVKTETEADLAASTVLPSNIMLRIKSRRTDSRMGDQTLSQLAGQFPT